MRLFLDKELKIELDLDFLDLGIIEFTEGIHNIDVPVYVLNDGEGVLRIDSIDLDTDWNVRIILPKEDILPNAVGKIIFNIVSEKRPFFAKMVIKASEFYMADKSKMPQKLSKSPKEEKIHCSLCGLDWTEAEYVAHLKLHRKEDIAKEYRKTKSELDSDGI